MANETGKKAETAKPTADASKQKVNRDYCFRHSLMYEGWECPRCADGDRGHVPAGGATGSSPARSAGSTGSVAPGTEAAPGPPRSRPQSLACSNDAQHLLAAGAPREALAACERAIELDPTNLDAFVVGARASQRLGDVSQQESYLEEAARLLRGPEHRSSVRAYVEVLRATSDASMARPIVSTFVAAGPWLHSDSLAVIRVLVTRRMAGEAIRVIEMVPPAERSLALTAYNSRLTSRGFEMSDPEVDVHLSRFDATSRQKVLDEYRELAADDVLPVSTVMLVRDAVRRRYTIWQAQIAQLLEVKAREDATEFLRPDASKPAAGAAMRVGGVAAGTLVLLAVILGGGPILAILGGIVGGAAGAIAFVVRRESEVQRRLPDLVPTFLEKLEHEEAERWRVIIEDEPVPQPEAPAAEARPAPDAETAASPAPLPTPEPTTEHPAV